jgi:23S rRNA pseudouridine1911/1915/1917 synthase
MTADTQSLVVDEASAGMRLDVYLAGAVEDASRSFLQKLIKDRRVTVNGQLVKRPSRTVVDGDAVSVAIPPPPTVDLTPQDIPLDLVHEDDAVVVVNKPAGLVVHPAPGHYEGTLVHALLHHCMGFAPGGSAPERPGIVHRLDRDTSGLLVVAKTPEAFAHLGHQVRDRAFDRRYLALVQGEFPESAGRIVANVGRSMADRKKMSVTGVRGKEAVTRFEVLERFGVASLVALQLETGRTHQIRVHLRFAGRPVLGDPTYGVTDFTRWETPEDVAEALGGLAGQALHAERLGFTHPSTGERLSFTAPAPTDFEAALHALRTWTTAGGRPDEE